MPVTLKQYRNTPAPKDKYNILVQLAFEIRDLLAALKVGEKRKKPKRPTKRQKELDRRLIDALERDRHEKQVLEPNNGRGPEQRRTGKVVLRTANGEDKSSR
jgi:hypothetical protein